MTIKIPDNYYVNEDIEILKKVLANYWLQVNTDLIKAYNEAENTYWFYAIIKNSKLFKIFATFPTPYDEIIKAFIEYNNPSFIIWRILLAYFLLQKLK